MKFESKAHMAQELMAGKRFTYRDLGVVFFDEYEPYPFRHENKGMSLLWTEFNKDVWEEVTSRHIHQDLIDSYQDGQAWQYRELTDGAQWENCITPKMEWLKPNWDERYFYRINPHNDLIQAFNNGSEIEFFEDSINRWLHVMSPSWDESIKYRVKPKTKTVYEWMYLAYGNTWILDHVLETESDASKRWKCTPHQKTGRLFEVPA
jgi:hypothetical protein